VRPSPCPLVLHVHNTCSQSSTIHVILVALYLTEEGVAVALSRCLLVALPLQYTCFQKAEAFEPATHTSLCQLPTVAAPHFLSLRRPVAIEVQQQYLVKPSEAFLSRPRLSTLGKSIRPRLAVRRGELLFGEGSTDNHLVILYARCEGSTCYGRILEHAFLCSGHSLYEVSVTELTAI